MIALKKTNKSNDYIRIEYDGDADVMMETIFISKKPIPRSDMIVTIMRNGVPNNYMVDSNEFIFINKTINASLKKIFEEKDYNGFKITIQQADSVIYYFISRKDSDSLFLKINAYLKNHKRKKDLIAAINNIRLTNVFPRKP